MGNDTAYRGIDVHTEGRTEYVNDISCRPNHQGMSDAHLHIPGGSGLPPTA